MARRRYIEGEDPEWQETIKGVEVTISMHRSDGTFYCSIAGDGLRANNKADLVAQIEKAIKKTSLEVKIPVTLIGVEQYNRRNPWGGATSRGWTRGTGTRHMYLRKISVDGHVLAVDEDGKKERLDRYGVDNLLRRLTDDEVAEYAVLAKEAERTAKAFERFIEKRRIKDPEKLVEKVLRESADDPNEDDDDGRE